jgi:hypothetical protein
VPINPEEEKNDDVEDNGAEEENYEEDTEA